MKKQLSKWLSILLPLFLGVFLIVYTYQKYSPEQIDTIKGHFENADYTYIVLSLIISVIGCASRAYRWKYSLDHMGYKNSFANNFMAVSIGYLMNMTVPRSGELSRALLLKKYDNVPFDKGFGTIVAERVVDTVILLLLVVLAFFVQFDVVKAFIFDKMPMKEIFWIMGIGSLLFIGLVLIYIYSNHAVILTLKGKIAGLKEGILSIFKMKNKGGFLFHTAVIWISYIMMFYVTIFTLEETSTISIGAVLTAFIVGSLAIAITSSGFGTYPVLIAKILLFYNIPETVGTAYGWIVWTSQIVLVLFIGVLSFLLLPVFNRKK